MPKDLFVFPCPCCGKQIELDTRTGKARAAKPQDKHGQNALDDLFASQKKETQRLDDLFDQAKDGQGKQKERLDDLLKRAKDDAKKTEDEKLQRPWDLD